MSARKVILVAAIAIVPEFEEGDVRPSHQLRLRDSRTKNTILVPAVLRRLPGGFSVEAAISVMTSVDAHLSEFAPKVAWPKKKTRRTA